jgi:carbon storage regulator
MLILSRKNGEKIMIGDNIELVILEMKGDQVKIGVEAPKSMKVYRGEVYDEIQVENREASNIDKEQIEILKELF